MASRDQLIVAHLPLVQHTAQKIASRTKNLAPLEDLVSAGCDGLIEASERYDPSLGHSFPKFAYPRIRGAIYDHVRRAAGRLSARPMVEITARPANDNAVAFENITSPSTTDPEQNALYSQVKAAVEALPDRERHIISRHFFDEVPASEAGRELGISKARASVALTRGLHLLRERLG